MTSKARLQGAFLNPDISQDISDQEQESSTQELRPSKSRTATVYDAVAGRISAAGFIPKQLTISSTRDTPSSSTYAAAPEAVLFRRKNAPTRYEESDFYFANERELRTELPESDLLKALHCYASDFYSRATAEDGTGDYRTLDETALIGLGVLMEEVARDTLGQTGDLVFTEGEDVHESPSKESSSRGLPSRERPSKKRRILRDGSDFDWKAF